MKMILNVYFIFLFIGSVAFAKTEKSKPAKPHLKAEVVGHEEGEDHHDEHEGHDKEKGHDHKGKQIKEAHEEHKEHGKHEDEEHGDHKEHGDHAESVENPQVGEGKGITAASAEDGIKLSPQAIKNFEIETIQILNLNSITVPKKAVVTAGDEVNLFRLRDGFYKRIDFDVIRKENGQLSVRSKELKVNDQIVVRGMGFLRIAEIAAFGGAPEGHSH